MKIRNAETKNLVFWDEVDLLLHHYRTFLENYAPEERTPETFENWVYDDVDLVCEDPETHFCDDYDILFEVLKRRIEKGYFEE